MAAGDRPLRMRKRQQAADRQQVRPRIQMRRRIRHRKGVRRTIGRPFSGDVS